MKIFILLLALGLCLAAPGGYQQIDAAEAKADPMIQGFIKAGLDAVVQHAIKKGFFSNTDFTLTHINSVSEQVVNGLNYKFDCNFTDSNDVDIHATFTIHTAPKSKITVSSFDYKVYYPPTTTVITTVTSDVPSNTTAANTTVSTEEEGVVAGESSETAPVEEASTVEETAAVAEEAIVAPTEEATVEEGFTEPVVVSTPAAPVEVSAEEAEVETTPTAAPTEEATVENTAEATTTAPVENNEEENTAEATTVSHGLGGFTVISADEFAQNEDLQKNFQYGFQTVVQAGINAKKIPNTIFNSSKVLSASQKVLKNGFLYKFTAQASNGDNVELNLTFNVMHQVPSYSYTVKITTTTPSNNTNTGSNNNTNVGGSDNNNTIITPPTNNTDTGSNNNTNVGGSDNNNTTTTPPTNNTDSGSNNNTNVGGSDNNNNNTTIIPPTNNTESSNNTNTTTPTTPSDSWVDLDVAQVQQNAEINSSLVEGFNQVVKTVIGKNKLKDDNYTITQVIAASRFNLTNGANYKFTVKAKNPAGTTFLDVNYTTYYRYSNKSVKTVAYQYKSSSNSTAAPIAPAQNNTSNNTNTTAPTNTTISVDTNNSTVPTNTTTNTTAPVETTNSTAPVETTNSTAPVNTTNTTVPVETTNSTVLTNTTTNTTAPVDTTNSASDYVDLSKKEIQAQDVQSALKYGAGQIVNIGKQQGKIPAGTYNLVQVDSVSKKVQSSGANYNCTVTLKNADKVTVNANFNVFSNTTSNAMSLQAYSFGVTGIKKN